MSSQFSRELAAVMFADMVGFTALMQKNEQLAIEKRARYRTVLEQCHAEFGGQIVQQYGDGALSIFSSAVGALGCAVAIQRRLGRPPEVGVRIGVHVGDVIVEPGGLIGDAVNIASRIESFGVAGAVLVSDALHDQVKNQPQFGFVKLGDFRLENVARPVGIYAVTSDGLTIPDVRKLEGKGEITVPSVGGVTAGDATSRARRRSSVAAAVGFIAVGVALGVIWVGGLISSSDIPTDTTGLAVPSTTAPTTSEPTDTVLGELWSFDTGSPVVGMASMDGLTVIATGDGLLRGVAIGSGEERWRHEAALPAQLGVFIDNGVVYYATAEGLYLLDPATGTLLDGCGFRFLGEVQGVAVSGGSVYFSMFSVGPARRVPTDPLGSGPCHEPAFESAESLLWPPTQSGPVVVGEEVLVGDSRRLTRLDALTLDLIDSYYLALGAPETYDGRVVGLSGIELRTQAATSVLTERVIYGLDAENTLYTLVDDEMISVDHPAILPPAATSSAVFVMEQDGAIGAFSHDLSMEFWTIGFSTRPTGLWLVDDMPYVGLADGWVVGLNPEDGSEIHRLDAEGVVAAATFTPGIAVMATETGRVTAFGTDGGSAVVTPPALERIERPTPIEPEAVVREFYDAIVAGDRRRVGEYIAVDATFQSAGNPWFAAIVRDELWALVDFFHALNVDLSLGACEHRLEGDSTLINCEVTQTDEFLDAFGVEIVGSARVTVEDGLIHAFRARTRIQEADSLLSGRRGLAFPPEADLYYSRFIDWAVRTQADSPCERYGEGSPTVECAAFMLSHVEEYLIVAADG